jgi:SAM-dependent methyltransferase
MAYSRREMSGISTMQDRVSRERAAYDEGSVWEASHRIHRKFYHLLDCRNTRRAENFFEEKLSANCAGHVVLDYGCLDGGLTPKYRVLGASRVIGIDISENGIQKAKALYGHLGEFHVCDAHDMAFINDGEIDFVVGRAVLHHLDFEKAMREVGRVLRPGGAALFVEPLLDNPASKLFRALTPKARTVDERPLSRLQIKWADTLFASHEHRYCNLVSTPVAMVTSVLPVSAENPLLNLADTLDCALEKSPFRYWMRAAYLSWWK